jgi:hypothetical protein
MSGKPRPNDRSKSILRLLTTHQALSFSALKHLMKPEPTGKQLQEALSVLKKRKVVERMHFGYFASASYYRIAEPFASTLGIRQIHWSNLIHNDACALTTELLRAQFPDAQFIPESRVSKCEQLRSVLGFCDGMKDVLPDVLMVLPSPEPSKRPTHIALEIERTVKSSKRIKHKLKHYGARTRLDGMAYLAPDAGVLSVINTHYRTLVSNQASRISHYKYHFMLTALYPTTRNLEIRETRNSNEEPVSIERWIQKLRTTEMSERSDSAFFGTGGRVPE